MEKTQLSEALEVYRWDDILAAARLVERLLPGECESCKGRGRIFDGGTHAEWGPCSDCRGSGQVWDEGIVEAVAKAIHESWTDGKATTPWLLLTKAEKVFWFQNARAVLSALVELLTEKVEP